MTNNTTETLVNETLLPLAPSPQLPCLTRPKSELLLDDGDGWLLFVPVVATTSLLLTIFLSSIVYTLRLRRLRNEQEEEEYKNVDDVVELQTV